jgi:hypothetical protein
VAPRSCGAVAAQPGHPSNRGVGWVNDFFVLTTNIRLWDAAPSPPSIATSFVPHSMVVYGVATGLAYEWLNR